MHCFMYILYEMALDRKSRTLVNVSLYRMTYTLTFMKIKGHPESWRL
jgi:hypothetical protein